MTPPLPLVALAGLAGAAILASVVLAADHRAAAGPRSLTSRPGESLAEALTRAGDDPADALRAERLAPDALDAGTQLRLTLARSSDRSARLVDLAILARAGETDLVRGFDGALRRTGGGGAIRAVTSVSEGVMANSLLESAERSGADPALIEAVGRLFAQKLDVARDIRPGDRFVLVFDREVSADRATLRTGALRYAEIDTEGGPRRFYAYAPDGAASDYYDEDGRSVRGFLLRTPLDGARVTSAFGMRLHPILGFTRMHQGIDFGAPVGTPVFAAGDGTVERAGLDGGYGNLVRLRHDGTWETAYAHLSAIAPGITAGTAVRQGQLIGFVGATGLATGPHLHFEVWRAGVAIDPAGADAPQGRALAGPDLAAFQAERARLDALRTTAPDHAAPDLGLRAAL